MRLLFLLSFLTFFAGANIVAMLTFCPAFSSTDVTIIQAKLVNNGAINCISPYNISISVIDPVGNVTVYSGNCLSNSTGVINYKVTTNLGGKYNVETTNATSTDTAFKHDTCTFNSLKKSKVSIPDSSVFSILSIFVLVGFFYYRKK